MTYFDHFAHSRGTTLGNLVKTRSRYQVFRIIASHLQNRDSALLEIGPGFGELATHFVRAGYHRYTVVEPNETMRNRLMNQGLVTKSYLIPKLQEDDNSYDAIILIDVFEHLNDTVEAKQFISEAYRVLRSGGLLCILSPDYLHWKEDFFNGDFSHSNVTSVRRTLQLFHNNKFCMAEFIYFSGFLVGLPATVLSNLARASLFFLKGNAIDSKLYKLKLTLLRQFLIVGVKEGG